MSILAENTLNEIAYAGGYYSAKPISTTSTLTAGATTITGALAVTGAITGPRVSTVTSSAAVGATVVLTAAQSGQININASTSGSPSWTLPAVASGLRFTFICGNTTAGFTVTSAATIHAKTSATGTAVSGTTLTNTQASAVVGDAISLICDGTAWWTDSQTGIFTAA